MKMFTFLDVIEAGMSPNEFDVAESEVGSPDPQRIKRRLKIDLKDLWQAAVDGICITVPDMLPWAMPPFAMPVTDGITIPVIDGSAVPDPTKTRYLSQMEKGRGTPVPNGDADFH